MIILAKQVYLGVKMELPPTCLTNDGKFLIKCKACLWKLTHTLLQLICEIVDQRKCVVAVTRGVKEKETQGECKEIIKSLSGPPVAKGQSANF